MEHLFLFVVQSYSTNLFVRNFLEFRIRNGQCSLTIWNNVEFSTWRGPGKSEQAMKAQTLRFKALGCPFQDGRRPMTPILERRISPTSMIS